MSERQGVEIDYCPQCRGVWLDRGELDKLVRGNDEEWRDYDRDRDERYPDRDRDERYPDRDREYGSYRGPKKKKRFLSEVFDFD